MGPVFVTGGTGFIGRNVVAMLRERYPDREVCVFSRTSKAVPGVTELVGDVTDPKSVDAALATRSDEWEAIIHLAGVIAYAASAAQEMEAVNVSGTRNVLQAIKKHAPSARLCYISSVAAVGANSSMTDKPLTESAPWDDVWGNNVGYIRTKRAAEVLVRDFTRMEGNDAVILCPTQVYGYGDASKPSRKTQIKVAQGKWPFYTRAGTNVLSIEACADVIVRVAVDRAGLSGERYILAGDNVTIQGMMEMYSSAANKPAPAWCFPGWLLRLFCAVGEVLGSSSFTRDRAAVSLRYHWFDASKARDELELKSEPASLVISRSVQYMKDTGAI